MTTSEDSESRVIDTVDGLVEHLKSSYQVLHISQTPDQPLLLGGRQRGPEFVEPFVVFGPDPSVHFIGDTSGVGVGRSGVRVPVSRVPDFDAALRVDGHPLRRLSDIASLRTFVYVDISDFSRHTPMQQSMLIRSLLETVESPRFRDEYSRSIAHFDDREDAICIGDGYIYVFKNALSASWFAASLAAVLRTRAARKDLPIEVHFRIGLNHGPVYHFWDPGRGASGGWNYIGDGINGGRRVLEVIDKSVDDVVWLSGSVLDEVMRAPLLKPVDLILNNLITKGRREDKHGKPYRVFELPYLHLHNHLMITRTGVRGPSLDASQ